jgi:predicted permease
MVYLFPGVGNGGSARRARGWAILYVMRKDLRFALRTLARSPMFTAVAVLSLALGIGANTSIFSLLYQVLYRSLPVRDPGSLIVLHVDDHSPGWTTSDNNQSVFSYPMYRDLRDRNRVFSGFIARSGAPVSVSWNGQTERARAEIVSGNLFDVLGVRALLGRTLTAEDDGAPEAHPVVMLSHAYWIHRFAGDAGILNQKVVINGHPMMVIGVAPAGFRGILSGEHPEVFVPIAMKREVTPTWDGLEDRSIRWLNILARLKPDVSPQQAQAALQTVYRPILESEAKQRGPLRNKRAEQEILDQKLELRPAAQGINQLREEWEKPLAALMALVSLVLLIACANVANLLLARGASRRREMAIRLALGAGRRALVRQLLIESLAIAGAGGLLGLLVSVWTTSALLRVLPADATGGWISANVDARLLAFTLALSTVTGLLFGLVPALQATRTEVASSLREQPSALAAAGGGARVRRVLVAAQLALSLLLLVGAGLFARSLINLRHVDPGFRAERLLTFSIDPRLNGYSKERGFALFQDLQQRLAAAPGVAAVGAASPGPLTHDNRGGNITVEGYQAREDEYTGASRHAVSPGYFHALGIPVVRGREVTERDLGSPQKVVVVNEEFVRRYFGRRNPLGRHMTFGGGNVTLDREIVGVVRDFKHDSLRQTPRPAVYFPYTNDERLDRMEFYVRGARDTAALAAQIRGLVRQADAGLPVFDMQPVEILVEQSLQIDRLIAILSGAFSLLATILAAIGLYGVVAYTVARRAAEIGIRMALGAVPRDVLWLVMKDVGMLVIFGLAAGMAAAAALGRLVQSQLFGLQAGDPAIYAGASLVLALVALSAGLIPGRRAVRIDPVDALRSE